jgi:hypothetical protein
MSTDHYRTDAAGGAFVYISGETPEEHERRFDAWVEDFHRNGGTPAGKHASERRDASDPLPGETAEAYRKRHGMKPGAAASRLDSTKREPNAYERLVADSAKAHTRGDGRISARRPEDDAPPSRVTPQTKFASLDPLEGAPGEVRRDDGAPAAARTPSPRDASYERNVREGLDAHKTSATRIGAKP